MGECGQRFSEQQHIAGPPEGLVVRASVGYNCFQWHKTSFRTADEMIAHGDGVLIRKPLELLDVLNSQRR
jgi:hypothetical protein